MTTQDILKALDTVGGPDSVIGALLPDVAVALHNVLAGLDTVVIGVLGLVGGL
jgi:hypothetical protein